ncbi:MAG: DUF4381 domain-containing protein [Mariprofundales bacterium]
MNSAPSLEQLRDIHLPDAVGWWPPAPGWWLLSALLLLVAAAVLYWRQWIQPGRRGRRLLRQQINNEISSISRDYQDDADAVAACSRLSSLMRRVALYCFSGAQVAGLQGEAWLEFLDQQALIDASFYGSDAGILLIQGGYNPHTTGDISALIAQCRAWMDAAQERAGQ